MEDKKILAEYIGSGCFLRLDKEKKYLAFVKQENRPSWLKEGEVYELSESSIPNGVLFFVKDSALVA